MTDSVQPVAEPIPHSVWSNPWHNLAFGFGSGTLPKAPGTWGSLVALAFVPLWQMLPGWGYGALIVASMLFGIWLCGKVAQDLGVHDHEGIVWDEFAGIWITFWLVPAGWYWLLLGFVVFRLLDILKPVLFQKAATDAPRFFAACLHAVAPLAGRHSCTSCAGGRPVSWRCCVERRRSAQACTGRSGRAGRCRGNKR